MPLDEVIDTGMAGMVFLAHAVAEATGAKAVYHCPTAVAVMGKS